MKKLRAQLVQPVFKLCENVSGKAKKESIEIIAEHYLSGSVTGENNCTAVKTNEG